MNIPLSNYPALFLWFVFLNFTSKSSSIYERGETFNFSCVKKQLIWDSPRIRVTVGFRWTTSNSQFHRKSEVDNFEVDKRSGTRRLQQNWLASELQTGVLQSNRSSPTPPSCFFSLSIFFSPFFFFLNNLKCVADFAEARKGKRFLSIAQ